MCRRCVGVTPVSLLWQSVNCILQIQSIIQYLSVKDTSFENKCVDKSFFLMQE